MTTFTTPKLLWIAQRGQPDISTAISFLCSRVQNPDIEDWKKLKRVLKYLSQTINETRIIGADALEHMQTFVDSSHAVHQDMKGHTGGVITFGSGVLSTMSSKQKMNSRCTNETEVIGNSEYLPRNIWHQHFMKEQGYPLKSNIFIRTTKAQRRWPKMAVSLVVANHVISISNSFGLLIKSSKAK